MAIRSVERSGKRVQVVIADAFTEGDARRIRELIRSRANRIHVTVDVRFARSCHALALLMLSDVGSLATQPPEFVGLSATNRPLLRYLDVS